MFINSLTLKNFRCFTTYQATLAEPFVLLCGPNGTGKTSILEALYYSCYLRSFKTKTTRELLHENTSAFSIRMELVAQQGDVPTAVSVGYSPSKRVVKMNETPLKSYKELMSLYRVIAMTDEDLSLITGYPEVRRSFIDQAISLVDPTYPAVLRRYVQVLQQRNALLATPFVQKDSYEIWSQQLNELTEIIRLKRQKLLIDVQESVNQILHLFFHGTVQTIQLQYEPRAAATELFKQEIAARRTLFGAHLDDFQVILSARSSRIYASRGQQKLLALLLKIAQPAASLPQSCIFLLDDIASDLDDVKLERFFALIASYQTQIIVTSPLDAAPNHSLWKRYNPHVVRLAHVSPTHVPAPAPTDLDLPQNFSSK